MKRVFVPETAAEAMGLRLREIRINKGFDQTRFGRLFGASQPVVARLERGTVVLNIIQLRRLAGGLTIDTSRLCRDLDLAALKAGF